MPKGKEIPMPGLRKGVRMRTAEGRPLSTDSYNSFRDPNAIVSIGAKQNQARKRRKLSTVVDDMVDVPWI